MCVCSCESFLPGARKEVEIVPLTLLQDEANTGDGVEVYQALHDHISLSIAFRHTHREWNRRTS